MSDYLKKMRLNITLGYFESFVGGFYFFLPIWYSFETQFTSATTLSLIYTVGHLITIALELPTGAFADLIGRRRTVLLGLLIDAFSWIYISQTKNADMLWIGYLINGIGTALISGADTALKYDSLKELKEENKFAEYFSKYSTIHRIGIVIAIFSGGYIYKYSQALPYILVGMKSFIGAVLIACNTEPKIDTEKFTVRNYFRQTKQGVKQLFSNNHILLFSCYYLCVGGITWYNIYFLVQAYATDIGFNDIEKSWLFSSIYLVVGVLTYVFVRSKKFFTRRLVYLLFPVVMVAGFLPGYWVTKSTAAVCILLTILALSARFAILDQYANKEFESKYRATALSALNMGVSLIFVVISILGIPIIDRYGTSFMTTVLGIMSLILVFPLAIILIKTTHKDMHCN